MENLDFKDSMSILTQTNISLLKTKINILFPVGGAIINEFLFDLYSRIKQDRVNRLVEELESRIHKLEGQQVNLEYIKSEPFLDLTKAVFETASNSGADFKRKFLANVYLDSIAKSDQDVDLKIIFTEFIKSMTAKEVTILKFINDNKIKLVQIGEYPKFYELFNTSFPNLITDKYEFKYYTANLESKSLISTGGGLDNFDDTSAGIALGSHIPASIIVTSMGANFISFLTE